MVKVRNNGLEYHSIELGNLQMKSFNIDRNKHSYLYQIAPFILHCSSMNKNPDENCKKKSLGLMFNQIVVYIINGMINTVQYSTSNPKSLPSHGGSWKEWTCVSLNRIGAALN